MKVYIFGYADLKMKKNREKLYAAVYESDHWKNVIAPRIPGLLDRDGMVVTRIVPTEKSTAQ